jgi:hypothetical protein
MKTNPGGILKTEDVVGRDGLIETIWETLETQGVIMTAERRIGKTSIIRKMCEEPREQWLPVLQDLEKHHSAFEFSHGVFDAVTGYLGTGHKAIQWVKDKWNKLGGTEVGGVLTIPTAGPSRWKDLLTSTIEKLAENQKDKKLVFFWDEMPYMLDSIQRNEGEPTAMELLDTLRTLRHDHESFRMVITGSIGLHHVISKLKDAKYSNRPLNDLFTIEVKPLDPSDAQDLTEKLLDGEKIKVTDQAEIAAAIAGEADCFPFYIHHVVRRLKTEPGPIGIDIVKQTVAELIADSNDPWELKHFRERLDTYYPKLDDAKLALAILDSVAVEQAPIRKKELWERVKSRGTFNDEEQFQKVLSLLAKDHYLTTKPNGESCFKFSLIRRWWLFERDL